MQEQTPANYARGALYGLGGCVHLGRLHRRVQIGRADQPHALGRNGHQIFSGRLFVVALPRKEGVGYRFVSDGSAFWRSLSVAERRRSSTHRATG
jgi:hypothetical protein